MMFAHIHSTKEKLYGLFNLHVQLDVTIGVAKRIGYGYRNDDHFFTLIKFLSIPRAKNPSPRKK